MEKFDKLRISLRYWLQGVAFANESFLKCIDAMDYAESFHKGFRKDGITKEFEHQLVIAHYVRTLSKTIDNVPDTICAALLHDVCEDYDVPFVEISNKFGSVVADAVEKLTKVHRGNKKNIEEYFNKISECSIASICKGADRIHNLQSMNGVFTDEKKQKYIEEAETFIIPCIKTARRNFPSQELAYENIKLIMDSQIDLLKFSMK